MDWTDRLAESLDAFADWFEGHWRSITYSALIGFIIGAVLV